MKYFIYTFLNLFFTTSLLFAQIPAEAKDEINKLFLNYSMNNSPGYAYGIVIGDELVYSNGVGIANMDYDIPITSKTAFNLASVSKRFTASSIAVLIDNGDITLEDSLSKFIPEMAKYEYEIQIKHLVYNTSGLTEYYTIPRESKLPWSPFHYFTIDEAISSSLSVDSLNFEPGTEWAYVNTNFMILAKIVENVSGVKFSEFVRENILLPLKMKNTLVHDDVTTVIKQRANGYNPRNLDNIEGYKRYGIELDNTGEYIQQHRNSPHHGGSGMYSTIEDLAKWSIVANNKSYFSETYHTIMNSTPTFRHNRNNQAFGTYHSTYKGINKVSWDGGDWGFSSELARFPDQKIAIICLANFGNGRAFEKVNQITDILIKYGVL
ncbi:MAG: serine hydrolase domain-containing protein [Balneolaceae bacterium]